MNFFALSKNRARRVTKFELASDVQKELQKIFAQQEADSRRAAAESIAFDGKYKPDDREVLFIDDLEDLDKMHAAIANTLSVLPIRPDSADFEDIKAIFTGRIDGTNKIILFQSFDKRRVLSNRGFSFFHSADVYKKVEGIGLTLDDKLCTILTDKKLEFFNFAVIRRIFYLSKYYEDATDEDIKSFASVGNVKVDDLQALIEASDTVIRRKVSFIMQSGILEDVPLDEIKLHAKFVGIDVVTVDVNGTNSIVLPTEKSKAERPAAIFRRRLF